MVQVLPYVQSPLERLTPYIAQAAGNIGQGIGQHYRNKTDQSILEQIQSGEISAANLPSAWGKLSESARNKYEPFLKSQLNIEEAKAKEEAKAGVKKTEKKERAIGLLKTSDEMEALLPYTGSTRVPGKSFNATPGGLNRTGLEKRNEFDTLAADAASFFRDLETKGQLPQGLYEQVIKPRLPNSELSERENLGRIKGIKALAKKYGGIEESNSLEGKKERPPLESFRR